MIYVITAVHNRVESTGRFIKCLNSQSYGNWHLIITDDGSTDGTETLIKEALNPDKVTIIKGNGNLWWTGGIQKGREFLIEKINPEDKDGVLIANNDVEFDGTAFESVENLTLKHPNTMILGTQFDKTTKMAVDNSFRIDWIKRKSFSERDSSKISALTTRFLFMDFATFVKAGDFAYKLLPHYHSDFHWTIRAKKRGIGLVLTDKIKFYLDQETSGSSIDNSKSLRGALTTFFSKKNRVNPIYLSIFELMSAPWGVKLYNFFSTWIFSILKLMKTIWKNR